MVKKLWRRLVKAGIAHHLLSMPEDWNGLDAKCVAVPRRLEGRQVADLMIGRINGLGKLPEGKKMRRIDILGAQTSSESR